MLHKSYVSEVVDPLSDHLANWHGSPDHGSDQLLDSTGLGHQHWITAARGVIETLTLDPMTGISYPLVSCLLHTKTGQHSLPPLHTTTGTPPRFTQLSRWSPVIDPHNGEDGPPTNQVAHRTPFIPLCIHIEGMRSLRHCTPYQWNTLSPQLPMVSHIGPREYASPAPMRHHNPFPLFH